MQLRMNTNGLDRALMRSFQSISNGSVMTNLRPPCRNTNGPLDPSRSRVSRLSPTSDRSAGSWAGAMMAAAAALVFVAARGALLVAARRVAGSWAGAMMAAAAALVFCAARGALLVAARRVARFAV